MLSSKGENGDIWVKLKAPSSVEFKETEFEVHIYSFSWWEVILAVIHDNDIHDVGQERPGTHQLMTVL